MSIITSILTGGANNHQTTSDEANAIATDFVGEGIVDAVANTSQVAPMTGGFSVNAQGTPDMTVAVGSGVAYVEGTPSSQSAQTFRVKNSASSNVTISANSSGSTKYDWLYIKLDATKLNAPNLAADDVATLVTSRSSSSSSDDGTPPTYGYPIAVITVANGATSIANANIRDARVRVALETGTSSGSDGWNTLSSVLSVVTGYNKGNKEYEITSASNMSGTISKGMRIKIARGTAPPTQCSDLESGSSQYAAKTSPSGITFTDDFTVEAWVKLESYTAASILSRYNGTSGWGLQIDSSGKVNLYGFNAASGNNSGTIAYQSLPLDQWVHVAVVLDMSTFTAAASPIYINGVSVPVSVTRAGTNPTALVQAGDLQLGATNGTAFLDGKLADVRLWSAARTATQIRDNMNQQLVGNETNLVGYWKLDGNLNDSTSNANNLTGSGGAVATNADNPMNATEYGIVTKITSTIITVFTGTDYNIPNGTLSTPYYSFQKTPYGFPSARGKWRIETIKQSKESLTFGAITLWTTTNHKLSVPTGEWMIGWDGPTNFISSAAGNRRGNVTVSDTTPVNGVYSQPLTVWQESVFSTTYYVFQHYKEVPYITTTQTVFTMWLQLFSATGSETAELSADIAPLRIWAYCAYI